MKLLASINFLDLFITAALAVLVPLLLLDRNVSVSEIGLILSALPLVFLFARMIFSALADQTGYKPFFVLDWLAQGIAIVVYIFAMNPLLFLIGKTFEGVRAAAFWAVDRTAIFSLARGKEGEAATGLSVVRTVGSAIGTAAAGFIAMEFGLHYALLFLLTAFLVQGFPALVLRADKGRKPELKKTVSLLLPFHKSRAFWLTALALAFYSLGTYAIFYLIAPVYMKLDLGMGYDSIGYVIAAYYLVRSLATFTGLRKLSFTRCALLQGFLFAASASLIAITGSSLFVPLFLIMALSDGFAQVLFEKVIAKETRGKPSVSTDIGYLFAPTRIAEFSSVILAGFAFQYLGYPVVFLISAIAFIAYSYIAWRILHSRRR